MSNTTIYNLREALLDGLGIVTRLWDYKTKSWVTNLCVADIDNDGEIEIVTSSRDGRVHLLSKTGDARWTRIIGSKAWIGAVAVSYLSVEGQGNKARIIVGTRDGKVYVLDKDGRTITKYGKALPFDENGRALDPQQELEACWHNTEYPIRQVSIDAQPPTEVIIGSEDRSAYGLDYETGVQRWQFQTSDRVRAVYAYDVNGDGEPEILIGSVDKNLYLLDRDGQLLDQHYMKYPVQTILAADINGDGNVEVLVATDGKDLVSLVYRKDQIRPTGGCFEEKWRAHFGNRLLALCVTDIDDDGALEIIAGSEDKHIYILDAQGKIIWKHNHEFRVFSVYPYDIDNDGLPELLIGSENDRVRAARIRLRRGVEKRIRRYYRQLEGVPAPAMIPELTADERTLLQDVLDLDTREPATLEQAEKYMAEGDTLQALSTLCKLEQQKVERRWRRNKLGYIRTVCLRQTASEQRREILIGTTEGDIYAFNPRGERLWVSQLKERIVDMQTGFIDQNNQEEIIFCSSEHHVHVLDYSKKQRRRHASINDNLMSSLCVRTPGKRAQAEIIIGSENKKLYVYDSDLTASHQTISTEEGVRIVRAHQSHQPAEENTPEIVAAGLGHHIYAFTRDKKPLWTYETHDHVLAICIKDINGDGKPEVLVGSEDRNIHVVDSSGHLLWRYYLPHSVLSVDAADSNHDGKIEVFAACADGCLYVFSREGDLLWTYQARDRIHAVRVEDIDGDGNVEIALGSEDEFELLRVVNQEQIHHLMSQCWSALRQYIGSNKQAIEALFNSNDPWLQTFALNKLAEANNYTSQDLDILERFAKEGTPEVRKGLAHVLSSLYAYYPSRARTLLYQLSVDIDSDVRNAVIEYLPGFMLYEWAIGFEHLEQAVRNVDRYVRRMVVRKLYQLIDDSADGPVDRHEEIFHVLLLALQDKESEWVRQEAARTLAHFLNKHHGSLVTYVHLFIVKGIRLNLWEHIAHNTTVPVVKRYLRAVNPMLSNLDEENVTDRLEQVLNAQAAMENLIYVKDIRLVYAELLRLAILQTLEDIANYQCMLNKTQFTPNNKYIPVVFSVFEKLSMISRPLKLYFRREGVHDRLASLLETTEGIDEVQKYLEHQYAANVMYEPLTRLPDRQVFLLLFARWRRLVLEQLNEMRGKAELKAELQTKDVRTEEQVCIWLALKNTGHSSANDSRITLLHSELFDVVGNELFKTEVIPPGDATVAEFTLKLHRKEGNLPATVALKFEIVYDNADKTTTVELFEDCLELRESFQEFSYIPNLYSSGTPTFDSKMFYGREKDMDFLRDNLTRDVKSVIVLYGQRRSGKTTMLLQLIHSSILGHHIPVLVDMQRASYRITIENFLRRVASYIVQAMKRKDIQVVLPEVNDFMVDPTHAFDLFLDQVEERLAGRKLILLVDEFEVLEEHVIKGNLQPEIFEYLRDIVQHRQTINFLFSGTHKITEYTRWYRSVFFNIALHYRLARLTPQGAEDLIRQPVAGYLEYEPITVRKIRQLTADQPYLIHLICRAIVDYCNERGKTFVTINDVNIVLSSVMQTGQFHLDWLWDQIKPEERVALAAIAEGSQEEGRWLPFAEIEEVYRRYRISDKHEYILDALKSLIENDFIEHEAVNARKNTLDNHRYRIPVGLTRSWLLREHPLELVRKEMNG